MRRYLLKHLTYLIFAASIYCGLLGIISVNFAEENAWTKKADMPTPRDDLSTSVVNGKIYAIGGDKISVFFSTVEEYNPVADNLLIKYFVMGNVN